MSSLHSSGARPAMKPRWIQLLTSPQLSLILSTVAWLLNRAQISTALVRGPGILKYAHRGN